MVKDDSLFGRIFGPSTLGHAKGISRITLNNQAFRRMLDGYPITYKCDGQTIEVILPAAVRDAVMRSRA